MTFDELKAAVATAESASDRAFDVLAELGGLVARAQDEESAEMAQAREISIRLVEHRDALGGYATLLDAMLRRLGLFPYIDPESAGVRDRLAIEAHRPLDLRAPITSPAALTQQRDELGVHVSVVMGARAPEFHPKLWLIRGPESLVVLSGSGNLTRGGLVDNDEHPSSAACRCAWSPISPVVVGDSGLCVACACVPTP